VSAASRSKIYLPGLDSLRGVAILAVLVHNLSLFESRISLPEKIWVAIQESGWVGVQLFFVLSGFLITGILVDSRGEPRFVRSFYLRRFFRIFPLYYAFLAFHFFVAPHLAPELTVPARQAPWYWLYLSNWSDIAYGFLPALGHTWSLAVEEQFYVVWPWVVAATRPRSLAWVCLGVCVASFAARVLMVAEHFSGRWLYASTLSRADALAMGALVALAVRSETWRPRLSRMLGPVAIATALALGGLVLATHGLNRLNPAVEVYGYTITAIGGAVLVAVMARPDRPASRADRVLGFFGKYSYALYVLHMPIKYFAVSLGGERLASWISGRSIAADLAFVAATGLASLLVSLVSWAALERPFLRLKDRLVPR
jgi:peptidoglycan/LPS O-acetylase OafA/YrhL